MRGLGAVVGFPTAWCRKRFFDQLLGSASIGPMRGLASEKGWTIVASVPAEGRIEVTVSSLPYGFTDEVIVRVKASVGRGTTLEEVERAADALACVWRRMHTR